MSAGITVEDFKYVRGVNDAEYIELLKNAYEGQKYITSKAIAKLKKQPEIIRCADCKSNNFCPQKIDCGDGLYYYVDFCSHAKRRVNEDNKIRK